MGPARRNPTDPDAAEVAERIAAARALGGRGHHLLERAHRIASWDGPEVHLAS